MIKIIKITLFIVLNFLFLNLTAQTVPNLRDTLVCRNSVISVGENLGTPPPTINIVWRKNGIIMLGENGTIVLNQTITQNTTYVVNVIGSFMGLPVNYTDQMTATVVRPGASLISNSPTCFNGTNGSISIQSNYLQNYGIQYVGRPYTYLFSNGNTQTTTSVYQQSNLIQGNYTVRVTDVLGCDSTYNISLVDPPQITIDTMGGFVQNTSCVVGTCNGSLSFTPGGGTPPYTYSWNNANVSNTTINNICPGAYTLTVRDSRSCSRSITANYTISTLVINTTNNITQPSCSGVNNGSITITTTNGRTPYTYVWSVNAATGNTNTASSLGQGTYNVAIRDANGCNSTNQTLNLVNTITNLSVNLAKVNNTCDGVSNGSLTVQLPTGTPQAGTAPYNYIWSANAGAGNVANASNLQQGSYSISVRDNNGCVSLPLSETITSIFDSVRATVTTVNPSCISICNGSINTIPNTGSAPYTYIWSGNSNTGNFANAINLCNGTYTLNIRDRDGCVSSPINTTLRNTIDLITLTNTIRNSGCTYGTCVGRIQVSATNGTSPYTYNWSANANTGNVNVATSLCPDNYTVEIRDVNGCTSGINQFGIISAYDSVRFTTALVNTACDGGNCLGSITANTPTEGTAPFTYTWSANTNTPLNDPNANNLCANNYSLRITDANNCLSSIKNYTIVNLYTLSAVANSVDVLCNSACDGKINLTMSNGLSPYVYNWSNSNNTANLNSLCPNQYNVEVTDYNNCKWDTSIVIVEPPALTGSVFTSVASCPTSCDGTIDINVTGGKGILTYSSTPNAIGGAINSRVCSGTYNVLVADENNCKFPINNVIIGFKEVIVADFTYEPEERPIDLSEALLSFKDRSTRADIWNWTFGENTRSDISNPEIVFTEIGTIPVKLVVRDLIGCTDSITKYIVIDDLFNLFFPNTFTPNKDLKNDVFTPKGYSYIPESFTMTVFNRWGSEIFTTNNIIDGWNGLIKDKDAEVDVYLYTAVITSKQGKEYKYKGKVNLVR